MPLNYYNLFQPRDNHGRWTNGQTGTSPHESVRPIPISTGCAEEWAKAKTDCWEHFLQYRLGPRSPFGRTVDLCTPGLVSERCGGLKVEYGYRRRR